MSVLKQVDVAAVVTAYQDGASVRALAKQHDVSHTVIHRRLIKAGVEMRPVGGPTGMTVPESVREAVADAYKDGVPMADIVAQFEVCDETVRRIADEAEIPRRTVGGQPRLDRDKIAELSGQGWPADAIAILVGGAPRHVRFILRQQARQAEAEQQVTAAK
ncbi:helix-turn-helix domain-containing protein [Nonomuraea glycinis]|uniref:helix-turn-helix domain-containing protein n=1 Tax=Nonomuraea glycinis TaxID=2047744 RepID=UPI0033A208DA